MSADILCNKWNSIVNDSTNLGNCWIFSAKYHSLHFHKLIGKRDFFFFLKDFPQINWRTRFLLKDFFEEVSGAHKVVLKISYLHSAALSGIYTNMKPYLSNIVAIIFNRLGSCRRIHFVRIEVLYRIDLFILQAFATEICIIYGRSTTSIRAVRGWFRKFGIDNFNMEDEERSGRSSNTNTELIKAMIDKKKRDILFNDILRANPINSGNMTL
ncbi:LOW QUALITY PROTEIN: Histone-lysine N-methyltransferase SETMAR [Vespula maculifrons]|uniref:Histone-lysine N-methyltransferase SETMAR n=1 Tax=Vespula maculifrons TaxID=7453 RepID=A0ABD2BZ87_VESMC